MLSISQIMYFHLGYMNMFYCTDKSLILFYFFSCRIQSEGQPHNVLKIEIFHTGLARGTEIQKWSSVLVGIVKKNSHQI